MSIPMDYSNIVSTIESITKTLEIQLSNQKPQTEEEKKIKATVSSILAKIKSEAVDYDGSKAIQENSFLAKQIAYLGGQDIKEPRLRQLIELQIKNAVKQEVTKGVNNVEYVDKLIQNIGFRLQPPNKKYNDVPKPAAAPDINYIKDKKLRLEDSIARAEAQKNEPEFTPSKLKFNEVVTGNVGGEKKLKTSDEELPWGRGDHARRKGRNHDFAALAHSEQKVTPEQFLRALQILIGKDFSLLFEIHDIFSDLLDKKRSFDEVISEVKKRVKAIPNKEEKVEFTREEFIKFYQQDALGDKVWNNKVKDIKSYQKLTEDIDRNKWKEGETRKVVVEKMDDSTRNAILRIVSYLENDPDTRKAFESIDLPEGSPVKLGKRERIKNFLTNTFKES